MISKSRTAALGLFLLIVVLVLSQSFETRVDQRSLTPAVSTLPTTSTFNYIVVITMLNASLSNIIGNPLAPYLNYLANTWGLANDYTVLSPRRVPNYLAMTGGSTFGVTTDCVPFNFSTTCPISSPNIADRIEGAGLTWNAWAEDYPVTRGCNSDLKNAGYDVKSFPFLYYTDITSNTARCNNLRRANTAAVSSGYETDDLFLNSLSSTSTATNYNWLSPNGCDSMHSCLPLSTIATSDNYLSNLVPAILGSVIFQTQKAALFITFAEGVQKTISTTDYVPTIWAGPVAKTGYQSSSHYDHYSMLKTIETSWGLTSLASNDGGAVDMNEFLNAPLGVAITASPNPTEVGTQVKLTAIASGGTSPYTSYSWGFGDGTSGTTTTTSTTHAYTSTGTFSTSVTATDSVGSKATSPTTTITVNKALTIAASASPTSTDTGVPVGFTASPAGGISPVSCNWTFGDGSSGSGCSTTHTYTNAGAMTAIVDSTDSILVTATASVSVTIYSQLSVTANASPNPTEANSQVSFTASASGGTATYSSYAWNFGDGATATTTTSTATHSYTSKGVFTATVKITDSGSSTATSSSLSVTVNPKLATSATVNSSQTDVGVSESFAAITFGGVGSPTCSWSFGDGSTGSSCSTSYTYVTAGTFTATVTVTDSLGITATGSVTITVNDLPVVNFSITPSSAFTGHPVNFTATDTGGTGPFTFAWEFGDGSQDSGIAPSHTYTSAGTFTVTVTVSDAVGNRATQSHSVTVTLSFGVTITSIRPSPSEVAVQVSLIAMTISGTSPYSCNWIFGDGSSGTGCSVSHTYASAGNFTATVNAADSTGKTATVSQQLVVFEKLAVAASASSDPTDVGLSTSLTIKTLGGVSPLTCSWSFGDGSSGTGCFPTHTYTTSGIFAANVSATDSLGVTAASTVTIVVNPQLAITAAPPSPNPAEVGSQVSFTWSATGGTVPYLSYSWSFGDGKTATTNTGLSTHVYTSAGTLTVTVTVTDSAGSRASSSVSVTINQKLTVTARAIPSPTEVSKPLSLTGTMSGGVGSPTCNWSFGDGTSGNGCSATHTYTATGTFTAVVATTDNLGVTAAGNVTVTVNFRLNMTAIANPDPIDADFWVNFTAAPSGGVSPVTCSWTFGDGSTGSGCLTTHMYTTAGMFTVTVAGTDSLGITATSGVFETVHPKLVVTATASPGLTEVGKLTGFSGIVSGGTTPITCSWSFGDGSSSIGCSSIHTYAKSGLFIANVTATDSLDIVAEGNVTVTVNPRLVVTATSASPSPTEVSKPTNFTGNVSGGVGTVSCVWNFGDGGASTLCSAVYVYSTSRNFTVVFTATDSLGVSAISNLTANVQVKLAIVMVVTPNPAEIGESTSFNGTTSHGIGSSTCRWNFGDGTTDTGCLAIHTFPFAGTFKSAVNATDDLGITVTVAFSVRIVPRLTVAAVTSSNPTAGIAVSFNAPITGGLSSVSCSWNFGDGSSGMGCSTTHNYAAAGMFTATVAAIDSHNVTSTNSITIVVALAVTISTNPSPSEIGVPVTFTATAAGGVFPYAFSWSFDDGASQQAGSITVHTFASPNLYAVRLTVTDSSGNTGSIVRPIKVQPSLTLAISSNSAGGAAPIIIRFNATAIWGVGPYVFMWDFGDGQQATGPASAHNYTTPDSYRVQVMARDKLGITASGSLIVIVTFQPSPPVIQPAKDPSAAGPIPAYYIVYGIGTLFAILILIVPTYAIMMHRRRKLPI